MRISAPIAITIIVVLFVQLVFFVLYVNHNDIYSKDLAWAFSKEYKEGDSIDWKLDRNGDQWSKSPPDSNNYWLRTKIYINEELAKKSLGIRISLLGSYDVFWDGRKIGHNGAYGYSKRSEKSGFRYSNFSIPFDLANEGYHIVTLRIASHHTNYHGYDPIIFVWDLAEIITHQTLVVAYSIAMAGVFLIATIYFALYRIYYDRSKHFLIIGLFCFVVFQVILLDAIKLIVPLPYQYHYPRLLSVYLLILLASWLLNLYFILKYRPPFGKVISILCFIGLISLDSIFSDFDKDIEFATLLSFSLNWIVVIYSHFTEKNIDFSDLIATSLCFFTFLWFDYLLYYSFLTIIVFTFYSNSRYLEFKKKEQEESLLKSKRLEVELLKKNIQPHFIMNSLTSIIAWIESTPKTAVVLVEKLAEEFSILINISDKKLIPMKLELELCETHLDIMGLRKNVKYILKENQQDKFVMIPPGMVLTIIENGISHNRPLNRRIVFEIDQNFTNDMIEFDVKCIGVNKHEKSNKDGTGLRYIKARLSESFGNKWFLEQGPISKGWRTQIRIPQV